MDEGRFLAGLLGAAIGCYSAGMANGAAGLIFAGVILELAFWFGLIKRR
ncbi:hypothetical protein [Shewanella pneumatophori]|uniref:Uncharacterized protein n=1 Tax=Shewanella pneumatophori TaxID=314092 RepID=A0A9X1ZPB3_9GAMM|nr:hypothetical protein [Shewanella pneumatophori]MCL1139461.1 hypothetical protein [Shewanella pneumatophori]